MDKKNVLFSFLSGSTAMVLNKHTNKQTNMKMGHCYWHRVTSHTLPGIIYYISIPAYLIPYVIWMVYYCMWLITRLSVMCRSLHQHRNLCFHCFTVYEVKKKKRCDFSLSYVSDVLKSRTAAESLRVHFSSNQFRSFRSVQEWDESETHTDDSSFNSLLERHPGTIRLSHEEVMFIKVSLPSFTFTLTYVLHPENGPFWFTLRRSIRDSSRALQWDLPRD